MVQRKYEAVNRSRLFLCSILTTVKVIIIGVCIWTSVIYLEWTLVSNEIFSMFPIHRQGDFTLINANQVWPHYHSSLSRTVRKFNLSELHFSEAFIVKPYTNPMQEAALPDLTKLDWPPLEVRHFPAGLGRVNDAIRPLDKPFAPSISRGQRALNLKMLHAFSNIMFKNGYGDRFFLHGGTLLGSYRHHDMIPWDDDIDILMDVELRLQVRSLLKTLEPDYLSFYGDASDKICAKMINQSQNEKDLEFSRPITRTSWGYPFLDIFYYRKKEKEIIQVRRPVNRYPTDVVFPLLFRPMAGAWFPAPFKPLEFLQMKYGLNSVCWSNGYSHAFEGYVRTLSVPCHQLAYRYGFVEHKQCDCGRPDNNSINQHPGLVWGREQLVIRVDDKTLRVIYSLCLPVHSTSIERVP